MTDETLRTLERAVDEEPDAWAPVLRLAVELDRREIAWRSPSMDAVLRWRVPAAGMFWRSRPWWQRPYRWHGTSLGYSVAAENYSIAIGRSAIAADGGTSFNTRAPRE